MTDDARARIIAATEQLFAEGGEEATSLRAITRAAQVNVAAIHYHFGGRDGLLKAVLDRIVGPLNQRRIELLDRAVADHGPAVPVDVLLDAFLRPDLELLADLRRRHVQLARFLGRSYTQPSATLAGFMDQQFQPLASRLFPLLRKALPELDQIELQVRIRLIVAMVTVLFASAPAGNEPGPLGSDDLEVQVRRLVAFCTAGLSMPSTIGG
jgi:AcrR family transcriptional regulator